MTQNGPRVLIIDDERNFREFLAEALEAEGFRVEHAATARAGMAKALRHVLAGETWQPEAREGEVAPEGGLMTQRIAALTPQQRNILSLMVAGKPNKIIAYELGIAETTVKAHITLILRKLGVFSRTQAVLAARDLVS